MSPQLGYWRQLNPNPFCNNYYILAIDVDAVATLVVVITTFCSVPQRRWEQIMFVVTGQNVVITTYMVATSLTSIAKLVIITKRVTILLVSVA